MLKENCALANSFMSRPQFFLISSAVIFIFERILPALTSWPIFIFPVFVILFMLTSKADVRDISYIAVASLVFDFFSGYHFGFFTFATLAVALAIFLFKTRFSVNSKSFFSLAIYTIILTFAYFAILSVKSDLRLMIDQALVIIIETLILFLIFNFAFRKVKGY